MSLAKMEWPEGKQFAFTIFDDTDLCTIENTKPVYDLMHELGFRTTKSAWPVKGTRTPRVGGLTCDDEQYYRWTLDLMRNGFEIGFHGSTYHTSTREQTAKGLERFKELFGVYPLTAANHTGCDEDMYWGDARLTGINRQLYKLFARFKGYQKYHGHVENHELFWGDLCQRHIRFMRNFVYSDINTLKMCPWMPYHDPLRPYVNYWYASSEGPEINSFNRRICESNQDQLESEGGACIMYAHLACGFAENGRPQQRFEQLMRRLAKKNGWFVPVAVLLDYLRSINGHHEISAAQRRSLEWRWLKDKLRTGPS